MLLDGEAERYNADGSRELVIGTGRGCNIRRRSEVGSNPELRTQLPREIGSESTAELKDAISDESRVLAAGKGDG
jgi:hypothetical protein